MFTVDVVRDGVFTCPAPPVEGKCGALKAQEFRYSVRLRADRLDSRQFVFESLAIHDYFVRMYTKRKQSRGPISCETMAIRALKAFSRMMKAEGRTLTYGVCRIWGFYPEAYIEVEFKP